MCLFLEVDVCDVFVFEVDVCDVFVFAQQCVCVIVWCVCCVLREREKREREKKKEKKEVVDQRPVRNSWSVRNCTTEHWYSFQLAMYHTQSELHGTDKCPMKTRLSTTTTETQWSLALEARPAQK